MSRPKAITVEYLKVEGSGENRKLTVVHRYSAAFTGVDAVRASAKDRAARFKYDVRSMNFSPGARNEPTKLLVYIK